MLRFNRIEDDEGTKQKKKYEESLKYKKEQLRQEFEHMEGIRRSDEQSVKSCHDFKFKAELDRLQSLNQQKRQQLGVKERRIEEDEEMEMGKTLQNNNEMRSKTGMFRSSTSNHHSDPLFETLSRNLNARSIEELCQLRDSLVEQEQRYQDLIMEEAEREESLKQTLNKVEHSKLGLVQEIQEMKYLNRVAENRFSNTESLNFLAKEKKAQSQGNLRSVKRELHEMRRMRETFKRNQEEKQRECKKDIQVGEEYVSHTGMKIEECEQKLRDLERQLEGVETEERIILQRRQKSKDILKYIECFEQFEQVFMNRQNEEGVRLVDQYGVNEDLIENVGEELESETMEEQFDRNELLSRINMFFMGNEQRATNIVDFMIEKYWQLVGDVEKNNTTYEHLLKEKGKCKMYLDILDHDVEDLRNAYLPDQQKETDNAINAGLITQYQSTTTLNIYRLEIDDMQQNDILSNKVLRHHNLLFNFLLSLVEFLHRSAQTLKIISNNSYNMMANDIDHHCNHCLEFLKGIFTSNNNHNNNNEQDDQPQQSNRLDSHQIEQIFREILLDTNPAHRKISMIIGKRNTQEQNMEHISRVITAASQEFYMYTKSDQIIWFYLTPSTIREFMLPIKQDTLHYFKHPSQSLNLQTEDLVPQNRMDWLRENSIQVFIETLQQLLQYYSEFQDKLKMLRFDLKIFLKEKDPKFDAAKLKHQPVRDGAMIKEARQKVLTKFDLYRTGGELTVVNKLFGHKTDSLNPQELLLMKGVAKVVQPEINAQLEHFMNDEKEETNDDQIQLLRTYFRSKLHQPKYESFNNNKIEEVKKKDNQKSIISEGDELEEERNQLKVDLQSEWDRVLQEKELKGKPQEIQPQNEKKLLIKEVTDRLYGDRGGTAQTLKAMSMTTGILSDIDRLDKQPSAIEQPNIISNYKLQKKNMHRNLNKELTLPSLGFLKPTSAYFSRRNQSQEQLRALAQKKYDLIESGMGHIPTSTTSAGNNNPRNSTRSVPKMFQTHKVHDKDIQKFYERYGTEKSTEKFVGYLLKQQNMIDGVNLQDFAFPQTRPTYTAQAQRPKSILVQPSY